MDRKEPATPPASAEIGQAPAPSPEHVKLVGMFGGEYRAPAVEAHLNQVLAQLAKADDTPSKAYRVTILNTPTVNAFALPSGNLYVTRGLLALANDTSEVAAVMAHEIAHVTLRHASQREEAAKTALLGAEAFASTLPLERRYWARTKSVEVACATYDKLKGTDACRALEKQVVGYYVFHDFSREHLGDRQLISHEKLVQVNEHYGILIKDCLAAEIRQIADKAAVSYLVNWLVINSGRVDNFHSISTDQDQSRFVTCLREQFGYWRYPSHEGDPQRIKQGFSVKSTMRATEETEPE